MHYDETASILLAHVAEEYFGVEDLDDIQDSEMAQDARSELTDTIDALLENEEAKNLAHAVLQDTEEMLNSFDVDADFSEARDFLNDPESQASDLLEELFGGFWSDENFEDEDQDMDTDNETDMDSDRED